jgi:hypothetical protein
LGGHRKRYSIDSLTLLYDVDQKTIKRILVRYPEQKFKFYFFPGGMAYGEILDSLKTADQEHWDLISSGDANEFVIQPKVFQSQAVFIV